MKQLLERRFLPPDYEFQQYRRSRVQQITDTTSNMLRRSGTSAGRSSPPNGSSSRSITLPASWGMRASNQPQVASSAVLNGPTKSKAEADKVEEDGEKPVVVTHITTPEEPKEIIDAEKTEAVKSSHEKINVSTVTEVTRETYLEEAKTDDKSSEVSNSNLGEKGENSLQTEGVEASSQDNIVDIIESEEDFSNLESQLPSDGHVNVTEVITHTCLHEPKIETLADE